MNNDPLSQYEQPQGDWLKQLPAKIRILETNPLVYADDKYGSTHFVFRIYNYAEKKVQVLDKTTGVMNRITQLHKNKNYGSDITKIDLEISSTGEGVEKRYTLDVLLNPTPLTEQQIQKMLASVDVEALYTDKNVRRLSAINVEKSKEAGEIAGIQTKKNNVSSADIEDTLESKTDTYNDIPF